MTLLTVEGPTDFTTLRERLDLSDGNLARHLRVLSEAGYIATTKGMVNNKPRTVCRPTPAGRAAFARYLRQLEAVLRVTSPRTRR
jgi:DNA-binding MarR family transcriptional regulator